MTSAALAIYESKIEVQQSINQHCDNFLALFNDGHWSLQHGHDVLSNKLGIDNLSLTEIAGLAKALQICQAGL